MRAIILLALGLALSVSMPMTSVNADGIPAAGKAKAASAGCVTCHGANGVSVSADPTVPNLAGEPDLFLEYQLVFFRNGTRKNAIMNAIAAPLSDNDIHNLSAFFASLPPAPAPAPASHTADAAPDNVAQGAKLVQEIHCANCHGDHLEGVDNIPRLAGQREAYLLKALRDYKSGVRSGTGVGAMAEVVYPLDDGQLQALANYLSRQ